METKEAIQNVKQMIEEHKTLIAAAEVEIKDSQRSKDLAEKQIMQFEGIKSLAGAGLRDCEQKLKKLKEEVENDKGN